MQVKTPPLFALTLLAAALAGQAPATRPAQPCAISLSGVRGTCPVGWNVIQQDAQSVTIGNFLPGPDDQPVTMPPEGSTITVLTMPKEHQNLTEWLAGGRKAAKEAVESKQTVAAGKRRIGTAILESPPGPGLGYRSYFFEANGKPLMVELTYKPTGPQAAQVRAAAERVIAGLTAR